METNDTLNMYMDMLGATNYNRRRTSTKMITIKEEALNVYDKYCDASDNVLDAEISRGAGWFAEFIYDKLMAGDIEPIRAKYTLEALTKYMEENASPPEEVKRHNEWIEEHARKLTDFDNDESLPHLCLID